MKEIPQIHFSSVNLTDSYVSIRAIFFINKKRNINEFFMLKRDFNLISCYFLNLKKDFTSQKYSKEEVNKIRNHINRIKLDQYEDDIYVIFIKQVLNWIDYAFNQNNIYFSMIEEKFNQTQFPSKKIFAEYMEIEYFAQ